MTSAMVPACSAFPAFVHGRSGHQPSHIPAGIKEAHGLIDHDFSGNVGRVGEECSRINILRRGTVTTSPFDGD